MRAWNGTQIRGEVTSTLLFTIVSVPFLVAEGGSLYDHAVSKRRNLKCEMRL